MNSYLAKKLKKTKNGVIDQSFYILQFHAYMPCMMTYFRIALLQGGNDLHFSNLGHPRKVPQDSHATVLAHLLWFDCFRRHEGQAIERYLKMTETRSISMLVLPRFQDGQRAPASMGGLASGFFFKCASQMC
jgi:hypothetical protein